MNQQRKYDIIVVIGRFQPFHIGHQEVISTALSLADTVIVAIGSANTPRTIKNPWTFTERSTMVTDAMFEAGADTQRLICCPLPDVTYNDQEWATNVQQLVDYQISSNDKLSSSQRVGIMGHVKDSSSYYLKMFPQWELIEHAMNEQVNATDLRRLLFEEKNVKYLQALLPRSTYSYVEAFRDTPEFKSLVAEYTHIEKYKDMWKAAPYPVTFVTVDACVVQSGHVLLVKRGAYPGKGTLALPGGYLEPSETVLNGMIRELREETRLKVPSPVLSGSIKCSKVYDAPDRSLRGRVVTHAFLVVLADGELPAVKGSDDAEKAFWVPLSFVDNNPSMFFEDHYHIIKDLTGRIQ